MSYPAIFTEEFGDLTVRLDEDDAECPIGIQTANHPNIATWLNKAEVEALIEVLVENVPNANPGVPASVPAARVYAGDIPLNEGILRLAALNDREVEFRYAKGEKGSVIEMRRLKPATVKNVGGHATFTGHDPDRDDVRAFRVDRIVGTAVIL